MDKDYFEMNPYRQKETADAFLEEALPWLEMGQHPNIVAVHLLENIIHPEKKRNIPFIFSEYMGKGSLKDLVIREEKLTLEETLSIALQICEGVLHSYKHGLSAHKDLKPDNIMVYEDSIYKVTDFSADAIGTFSYMAPEQVAVYLHKLTYKEIDHHADQFAIGLIMHDLFKGYLYNEQKRRVEYIKQNSEKFIKEGIKEVLSNDLPIPLKDIITRCLQPKKEDRFKDISELKNKLLEAYKDLSKKEYCFPEIEIDDSAVWWFNRGMAFYNIGRYASAEVPLKNALNRLFSIPGTEIEQAKCLANMGIFYCQIKESSKAKTQVERFF